MTIQTDHSLAVKMATMLNTKFDYICIVELLDTGIIEIRYGKEESGKLIIPPPIRVHQGGIIIPKGSPEAVLMALLGG